MKLKIVLLMMCCTVVAACTYSDRNTISDIFAPNTIEGKPQKWNLLVGGWYGEAKLSKGGVYKYLVYHEENGKFKHETKFIKEDGRVYRKIDIGEWGMDGDIYFSVIKGAFKGDEFIASDQADPYLRRAYKILELSENKFVIKYIATGDVFVAHRTNKSSID